MNFIDIIISIFVLLFAYKGLKRGIIKELISLLSLILGIYIAINFSFLLEDYLTKNLSKYEEFVSIISFTMVFLIVFLSLKTAGFLIRKLVKSLQLGFLDKLLGLLFGASKIALILSFLLLEIQHLSSTFGNIIPQKEIKKSVLYRPVYNIVPTILPIAKERKTWTRKLKKTINKAVKDVEDLISE